MDILALTLINHISWEIIYIQFKPYTANKNICPWLKLTLKNRIPFAATKRNYDVR